MSEFPIPSRVAARSGAAVDAGLRAHMQRVYNRMTLGLFITFVTSYLASQSPTVVSLLYGNPLITMVLMLSPLALIWFGFRPDTMSSNKLQASFALLSVLYGLSFTAIFLVYMPGDIARALLITTAMFAGLSIIGYTIKRDLAPLGVFCIMAMWGLLAFSLINMIGIGFGVLQASATMNNIISIASIVIFSGLTAWETQTTKEMYNPSHGEEGNSRLAWMAALNLYISFIALFQSILQLMSSSRE